MSTKDQIDISQEKTSAQVVEDGKLKRSIGLLGGSGLIFGCIVGSGIFITPSKVLEGSGSIAVAIIIWAVTGVISGIGGLCFAELGTTIPESGAEYNYILEGLGPLFAFAYIWTSVFVIKPACVAIVAITCAIYMAEPFYPDCFVPEIVYKLFSAMIIVSITLLNALSVKWSIKINNLFVYSKIIAILMFLVIGFYSLKNPENRNYLKPSDWFTNVKPVTPYSIGSALFQGLWAYDGFNNLNYAAEEMINPNKNLPNSIKLGMGGVILCYILINICYIAAIGPLGILESDAVGMTIGKAFLGSYSWIVSVLVACCTFGAAISTIFGNGRLLYVAARRGHLPLILASVHRTLHTPIASLVFTAAISLIMLIPKTENLERLINIFGFSMWIFFFLCFLSQIVLRYRRPDMERPYKVNILLPIIMCCSSLFLIILPINGDWVGFVISLAVIISAFPVYFLFICCENKALKNLSSPLEKLNEFIMDLFDLKVAESEQEMG